MDYGNKKVSVGGLQHTFYSNLDSVRYPVTALLSSSKLLQNIKETKRTYRCILGHDSPSRTLGRAAKTRCMNELGKGCLHILPARTEKDLKHLHWRAQQRSEQKVLGHLLKQTEVRFKAGNRWESKDSGYNSLFWLCITWPFKTSNTRLQFQGLFQCHPCSAAIQEKGT